MRLTLRTLLAYMDDILDPADHDELGQKVESSDFATELIHRTRDTVRRLRLGAPAVDAGDGDDVLGDDSNLDANAVAEYLDNTMPPEQVAEFERCCLEMGNVPDMRLAEVASCHHILTMVLGEPADVRPAVRERMYALPTQAAAEASATVDAPGTGEKLRIEPAHGGATVDAATASSAPPVAQVTPASRAEDVPDYLRAAVEQEQRGRRWKTIGLAALILIAAGVGFVFWPAPEADVSNVAQAIEGDLDAAAGGLEIGDTGAEPGAEEVADAAAGAATDASESGGAAPAWSPDASTASPPSPPVESPAADDAAAPPTAEPPAVEAAPSFTAELPTAELLAAEPADGESESVDATDYRAAAAGVDDADESVMELDDQGNVVFAQPTLDQDETATPKVEAAVRDEVAAAVGAGSEPERPEIGVDRVAAASAASSRLPKGAVDLPDDAEMPPEEGPAQDVAAAAGDDPQDAPTASEPEAPAGPVVIGEYQGNDDLLLAYDAAAQQWIRMPGGSKLQSQDQLLTLPMFRTHVQLDGVSVYLVDGAEIELLSPEVSGDGDAPVDAALELSYGQLLLSAGLDGNRVLLTAGDVTRDLRLDASADLAVEVRRRFVPGAALSEIGPLEVNWYLTTGSMRLVSEEGEASIDAPSAWRTEEDVDSEPGPFAELPGWVEPQRLSSIERGAMRAVGDALDAGKPVAIRLLELSDKRGLGRRFEVRSLAAKSGAYVGVFEPFVRALNDPDLKAVWDQQIETMREALARNPRSADQLQADLESLRGEVAAADLLEMLLGYDQAAVGATVEEQKEGILPTLIRRLDSDTLDYRVLAAHNLNQITGKSYNYRPQHSARQRQRALRIFWDRLDKGELMPRDTSP